MRKDTEEELERLESWLLAEEEEEEEITEEEDDLEEDVPLRNYATGYHIYNSDRSDENLEEFSEEVRAPKKDRLTGLMLIFVLLCLGITCVFLWWLLRWKGVIG